MLGRTYRANSDVAAAMLVSRGTRLGPSLGATTTFQCSHALVSLGIVPSPASYSSRRKDG